MGWLREFRSGIKAEERSDGHDEPSHGLNLYQCVVPPDDPILLVLQGKLNI